MHTNETQETQTDLSNPPLARPENTRYANADEMPSGRPGYTDRHRERGRYYHETQHASRQIELGYANVSEQAKEIGSDNDTQGRRHQAQSQADLLTKAFDLKQGQTTYRVYPVVTPQQAQSIEQQTGVVLKTEGGKISGLLGTGSYGHVYVGEILSDPNQSSNHFCAVKIIQGSRKKLHESLHEAFIQRRLQSIPRHQPPHAMPLIEAIEVKEEGSLKQLYYILPLAALGDVEELGMLLPQLDNPELKRLLSVHIAQGLLWGLWQLHQQQIYHLDVKLANLLVNGQGEVWVSDFGTSEWIETSPPYLRVEQEMETGRIIGNGDSTYFPPERGRDDGCCFDAEKADVFSAGAALWEFITGEAYPQDVSTALAHARLQNPGVNSLSHLSRQLLKENPAERWTLVQALNHPIFQAAEMHNPETMAAVTYFLKRFVQQSQLKARDPSVTLSLADLNPPPSSTATETALAQKLAQFKAPFAKRPDIQEQLSLYLPLRGSHLPDVKAAEEDNTFDLAQAAQTWLEDPKETLLLLLADGGAGKSLFSQHWTNQLLSALAPSSAHHTLKPWLPLYVSLSDLTHPDALFQEGLLGLTPEEIAALNRDYRLLLILDGYDEQPRWTNLYLQNALYRYDHLKLVITCRANALPPNYRPLFEPQAPNEPRPRALTECYVQPFTATQIERYVQQYVEHQLPQLKAEVAAGRLEACWLNPPYYQQQIENTLGLKELMETPLLCRLTLEALPELAKRQTAQKATSEIRRAHVYEAFLTRWISQQLARLGHEANESAIAKTLGFGEQIALTLYDSRSAQIQLAEAFYAFDPERGLYQRAKQPWQWFIDNTLEKSALPLQVGQRGQYKFMHLSMQEFLLARHLYQQLMSAKNLQDLDWNHLTLTVDEKDRPVLYFLGDWAESEPGFKERLLQRIHQSKTDKTQARAAANAMTVLVAGEILLIAQDFTHIAIPQADLSGGVFDSCDFTGADLRGVNVKGAWLRGCLLREAHLLGLAFHEWLFIEMEGAVNSCAYSPDGRWLAVAAGKEIQLLDAKTRKRVRRFSGHTDTVMSVQFSPSGERVVSGSEDQTVRMF